MASTPYSPRPHKFNGFNKYELLSGDSPCYRPPVQPVFTSLEVGMRPLRDFLLIVVVIFWANVIGHAQSPDDVRLSITKDAMDEIAHDQLVSFCKRFSPDLKDSFTQDQMKVVLDELVAVTGAFQKQISQGTRTVQGAPIYVSKSQFENFKVELRLAFDDNNQITRVSISPISDLSSADMEASARAMTDLLRQKRFDLLGSKFNDRMKSAMPPDKLDASWSHVILHLGQFKSIKLARKDPEFDMVDIRCEFEHGEATVRVAFDPSGKVSGLWMLPAQSDSMGGRQI